jgi:TolB-like protein
MLVGRTMELRSDSLSPDRIRAQLELVLAADMFANAGRISRLLRYVVERTVAGEGDQLKEYVVGTEVFDRGTTYDPRLDSIVRVEARRLRAKLDDYYQGPGKDDDIVITMPRGSYVPAFGLRAKPVAAPDDQQLLPPEPATRPGPDTAPEAAFRPAASAARDPVPAAVSGNTAAARWRSVAVIGFFAGVITVVVVAGALSRRDPSQTAQASSGPSVAVLLFHHYSASADDAIIAAKLTDGVTTELARLGTVSVASRASTSQYIGEMRPAREIAASMGVDFIMEATVTIDAAGLHVVARLVDGQIDRKVWVGEYDAAPGDIRDLARRIALESAAAAVKYKAAR